jgi:predicted TPR repeat methyltransferase
MTYKPRDYWETRLSQDFSLGASGHIGFSRYYNRFMYKLKVRVLEKAVARHNIEIKGSSVIDIGSGTGYFVGQYIKKQAREVTGIDIAEVSVSLLKKKFLPRIFTVLISAAILCPLKKDLILSMFLIFYIISLIRKDSERQ